MRKTEVTGDTLTGPYDRYGCGFGGKDGGTALVAEMANDYCLDGEYGTDKEE